MDARTLSYLPLVTPIATLIVVIAGVLFTNWHVDSRIHSLRHYLDARFDAEQRVNEANFKMLIGKVEDIDMRLSRLEERFAR
jgi:hypothetical protein